MSDILGVISRLSFLDDVYAVGGCVRDQMMGLIPGDIDIATRTRPDEVIRRCEERGIKVIPTGIDHGTVTAIIGGDPVEITTFRRDVKPDGRRTTIAFADHIEHDLSRRDFTINAMAIDCFGQLIDPFRGEQDLQLGILRTVGSPDLRFREDLLRIMRLARFSARFEMDIHLDVWKAARIVAPQVAEKVSMECIRDEFDKAFRSEKPSRFLEHLINLGVMENILPELCQMMFLHQHPEWHPEGDVLIHTLEVVDRSPPELRWYALLHDIGKPSTAVFKGGWYSFPGHESEGADMIPEIARRLKFPNALRDSIEAVTRLHMLPLHMSREGRPSRAAVRRFQAKAGEHLKTLETLCRADAGESFTSAPSRDSRRSKDAWVLFEKLPESVEPVVMGRHLIARGMTPGPHFKEILDRAFDLQMETGETDADTLLEAVL